MPTTKTDSGLPTQAPAPGAGGLRAETVDTLKTLAYALGIALVIKTLAFQPFTIPSPSMEPNLYEGDYIVVSKWDYGYSRYSLPIAPPFPAGRTFGGQVQRGDVVVFKKPSQPGVDVIKRVIGLPGDRIQMREARLYINDQPVQDADLGIVAALDSAEGAMKVRETLPGAGRSFYRQDLLGRPQTAETDLKFHNTGVFTVPAGHYFVMGDNRDNSNDSRVSPDEDGMGYVPAENLVGKARFILMSWKQGASLFKPWTWLNLRLDRMFKGLA